jgi:putative ABC transport system permease protein
MIELTLASWRQHRRRYVATFLAVFLGVAFCGATLSLTEAARQGATDAVALPYSRADVVALPSAPGIGAFVTRVSRLPDVSAVSRVDTSYVDIGWPPGHVSSTEEVSEIPSATALRWQRLASGVFPSQASEVVVDAGLAAAKDVRVGTVITVQATSGARQNVTVVGLTTSAKGATDVSPIFTSAAGLRAWGVSGHLTQVMVRGSDGSASSVLRGEVQALAPEATVETTDTLRDAAVNSLTNKVDVLGRFLQGFALISLFVAALVIANTFRIVMAQRLRDLALLRCVGAERWQVFSVSLGEAGLLGICAAAVGTAAGIAVAAALVGLASRTSVDVPLTFVMPGISTLALPFLGGLAITLAAALSPAWWASRVSPLAAMSPAAPLNVRSRAAGGQAGVGVLLGVVGGLLLAAAAVSGQLVPGLVGGLVSFAGVLALTAIVVPAAIRLVGKGRQVLPRHWRGGVPTELSVLNATRNPRRTAATAAALLVGVTLISMMSVGAASISATESGALDRVAPVDLIVSGGAASPRLLAAIEDLDGVRRVVPVSGVDARAGGGAVAVGALTSADSDVVRDAGLRAELSRRNVVVVPVSEQSKVPGNGGRFSLRSGGVSVPVKPIYSSLPDGPMLVAPSVLARLGGQPRPLALFAELGADADPGNVLAAAKDAIAEAAPGQALTVTGGLVKRSTYDRAISVLLVIATALLGVAVLIALVGVGNTLSLSVLERTRENGLLRALGLTTRQLRWLLANEAVLIAGAAAVLGAALGVVYGWAGTLTLLHGATNHSPTLVVPFARLGLIVGVAMCAGLLASVLPARRAVRLSPTAALASS